MNGYACARVYFAVPATTVSDAAPADALTALARGGDGAREAAWMSVDAAAGAGVPPRTLRALAALRDALLL